MGIRFRKTIRLGDWVRLNISRSGVGASVGIPGFRVGVGPRGARVSVGIPGSGLSYVKEFGMNDVKRRLQEVDPRGETTPALPDNEATRPPPRQQERRLAPPRETEAQSAAPYARERALEVAEIPQAGWFASATEKHISRGTHAYLEGDWQTALDAFWQAAPADPGAAILAASLLAEEEASQGEAVALLEETLQHDGDFPTPLMDKYLAALTMPIQITPHVIVDQPIDGIAATLLLTELYQYEARYDEAIGLLQEIDQSASDPVITLSLCELLAIVGEWDEVIELGQGITVNDDVTLKTAILYAHAMQAKGLHEAAITVFTEALRRKRGLTPELVLEARYWRAISYERVGRRAQAKKEFQAIYAAAPSFRDVAERVTTETPPVYDAP